VALATLTIDINAKLANIEQDLGKVSHLAEQSAARMTAAFAAAKAAFAGLAAGFSVGAIVDSIRGIINLGDEMNDLSQRVGISVKDLGTWTLAAAQSGTSLESLAKGVKGLSTFIVENGDALKKAGITATDANGALIQLADLFAVLPDGVEKTALAVKLFGKAGMDMIPMLNQGSKGLQEAADKSKVYSERLALLAPAADRFNDQLAEIALHSKETGLSIANSLLPALTGVATWLNDLKSGGERAEKALEFLSEKSPLFRGLVEFNKLTGRGLALAGVGGDQAKRTAAGNISGGAGDLAAFDEATAQFLKDRAAKQTALDLLGKGGAAATGKLQKVGGFTDYEAKINEAVAGAIQGSAVVKARELADQIERLDRLFFDSGLDAEVYTSALQKLTGMTAAVGKESERLNQLLDATPTAKLEEIRTDMQLLADAFDAGKISEEQFSEATLTRLGKLGEAFDETTEFARQAARNIQDAFADGLFDIMQGNFDQIGASFKTMLDRMVANAIAADIGRRLLGNFGSGGEIGGLLGDLLGGFKGGYSPFNIGSYGNFDVPQYASGTPYVPSTGLALIHQGERIIPAEQNRRGFGGNIIIHVNGAGNAQDVRRAAGQGAREALAAFSGAQRYA